MKQTNLILLFIVSLSACTSSQSVFSEGSTPIKILTVESSSMPAFTSSPQPTNSPEPSLTATIDYQSLTAEEKIQLSQSYIEQANSYSGEVRAELKLSETIYNIYWDSVKNEWRSEHNTPIEELDKMGESFPDLTLPGYENPDGTLVLVDPITGKETVFPKPILPGKGETSLKDFYNLSQSNLGLYIIDGIVVPALDPTNEEALQTAEAMKQQALFLAGYTYGEQNKFYAGVSSAAGGNNEIPEEKKAFYEVTTNQFMVPVFSPETGDFIFFLNIQQGNPFSTMIFSYDQNGGVVFTTNADKANQNIGGSSQNEFGMIIENRRPDLSHWEGGFEPLLQGNEGIGSITEIEAILNAKTEEEILNILKKYKIFVSYPSRVVIPKR